MVSVWTLVVTLLLLASRGVSGFLRIGTPFKRYGRDLLTKRSGLKVCERQVGG